MAERLKSYEFSGVGITTYPWDEWLDGSIWRLEKGRDFECRYNSFRSHVHVEAKKRGLRVRTSGETATTLVIQAYKPSENGKVKRK